MFPPGSPPGVMMSELNRRNKKRPKGKLDIGTIVDGQTVLVMWGEGWTSLGPKEAKQLGRKLLRQADEATRIQQFGVP